MEVLDTEALSLQFWTSDEVGFLLIEKKPSWDLYPVKFAWGSGPSLLELHLHGFEDVFKPPKPNPKHHQSCL